MLVCLLGSGQCPTGALKSGIKRPCFVLEIEFGSQINVFVCHNTQCKLIQSNLKPGPPRSHDKNRQTRFNDVVKQQL